MGWLGEIHTGLCELQKTAFGWLRTPPRHSLAFERTRWRLPKLVVGVVLVGTGPKLLESLTKTQSPDCARRNLHTACRGPCRNRQIVSGRAGDLA